MIVDWDGACGTCGSKVWKFTCYEGDCIEAQHWIVECWNGHRLIPTGGEIMLAL